MGKAKRKWIQLDWNDSGVLRAQDIPYDSTTSIKAVIDQNAINGAIASGVYTETVTSWTLDDTSYYATINHNLGTTNVLTEFYLTATSQKIIPQDVEIIDDDNIKIWFHDGTASVDVIVFSGSAVSDGITVKESSGDPISPVTTLEFNQDSGFVVTDEGNNTAKVSLGSHWKDIVVDGQTTLIPLGEETLKFAAGEGISIATDASSAIQTITLTSTGGSVDLSAVDQDIVPDTTSTRDLGTTDKRWKTLWADDIQVTGNSIYINGKKVLEDISDTINVTTSVDQDLKVKTSGTGDTFIESDSEVIVNAGGGVEVNVPATNPTKHINYTNQSTNGNLTFTTTGAGGQVQFSSTDEVDITAPLIDLNGAVNTGTNTITCGGVDAGINTITCGDPTEDTHAATKSWVSTSISNNTVASSINNITNPGGNIDIIGGDNVIVTPNDTANTITIDVPPLLNIREADATSSVIVSTDVQDLEFDSQSGFVVTDNGSGSAKVSFSVTTGFIEHFEYSNLVDGILTIQHNLDNKYVLTSIYDSTSSIVICPVTLVDNNCLELDLSSMDTFPGFWSCIVTTPGTTRTISKSGEVAYFASDDPPSGYLECDGSELSRSTYDKLFDTIGTTHGVGNGTTTFNIPDLRGEFIRGWDNGRGVDPDRELGTYQGSANAYHRHSMGAIWSNGGGGDLRYKMESSRATMTRYTTYQGASSPTEARPRNKAMLVCIKY